MRRPRLEIGLVIAFLPLTVTAAGFCGYLLKAMVNPESAYTTVAVLLSVLVLFLSAVSFALVIALVSQAITSVGGFSVGFWPAAAALFQELAIWLVVHWALIWGVSFGIGMSVFANSVRLYGQYTAGVLGVLSAVLALLLIRRLLPREVWRVSSQFDPARGLGWKKGLALFFLLTSVGYVYLHMCYVFEVSLSSSEFRPSDTIEIRARLSGRVTSHRALRARIASVGPMRWNSGPTSFNAESDGRYVTWIELNGAPSGVYRITVFFDNFSAAPFHKKLSLWMGHNHKTRSFVIRVRQPIESA